MSQERASTKTSLGTGLGGWPDGSGPALLKKRKGRSEGSGGGGHGGTSGCPVQVGCHTKSVTSKVSSFTMGSFQ